MAIRFLCPSCRQPIEVDDTWAGQSVACPYCRKVVSAPAGSTWPPGQVPVASPSRPAFAPPPPPGAADLPNAPAWSGTPQGPAYPAASYSAPGGLALLALTLAVLSAVCCTAGGFVWMGQIAALVLEKAGPNPSQAEQQKAVQDLIEERNLPTSRFAAGAVMTGVVCAVAGLFLAIRSLVRRETRRVAAIAACVISLSFLVCQVVLMLMMVGAAMGQA